ncbi:MAG: endonuclease/exonuclease/phosphatase family protein [Gemmatimonadota bacterium]|nr:endonuclease/exonuclease/phosphatase family protein [Gemmatimonadota bacterium]
MKRTTLLLSALAIVGSACMNPTSDAGEGSRAVAVDASVTTRTISVISRNLYVGADVDRVIGALATPDPTDDLPALLGAIAVVQATDFPARARALAREIERQRPHVVGLQEVSRLDIDLTPLGIPAPVIHQDFLATLLQALADRGLDYRVAATVQNTTAAPLPGVSLVDFDALLYDARRADLGPVLAARQFQQNIGTVAPGVTILRGYVAAEFRVNGRRYTVLNTHLESGTAPGLGLLRAAQATELAAVLGTLSPAILLGDFNDYPGSLMHQVLSGAGFTDLWAALYPGRSGFTCCHAEDLSNPEAAFDQRIDYVWTRGIGRPSGEVVGRIGLLGARAAEKFPGPLHPLWPSDHAGLAAVVGTSE